MSQMANLLKYFPEIDDGPSESRLKGVLFFKETKHIPRRPMVYNPGICIVAQGHKIGYLGGQKFRYDANSYLVTTVTMPFECETFASPEQPLRGLYIDIDMGQLHDLIGRIGLQTEIENGIEKTLPRGSVRLSWMKKWRMRRPDWSSVRQSEAESRCRSRLGAGNYLSGSLRHPGTGALFTGHA